ncbi:DJ-1 family glyoxalase III [Paludibacter sp.]|uniref:DJ-1 family glyoxalase III n=1 Tax=Paludibacter sp. TaxID=1898105 RepID=UPI001352949F|nr:DJ-1 family glyoxalase III [Paludibacter sp.]MTK54118.1 DJ-1/PfpI family protein [Paludibacter sp.]
MLNRKGAFIFLATGFEEIEAVATIDVLRRGNVPVTIISITKELTVTGAHNINIVADALFEEVAFDGSELLILPGGMPGSQNLQNHEALGKLLQAHFEQNKLVAAICAAPKVFGHLNILNGKKATCYPGFENELLGAVLSNNGTVRDENIVTAKGAAFAIEFGLQLVEILQGKEVADKIAQGMLMR